MIRLNIQLNDEQDAQLRKLSYETRESVAAIIRKMIDKCLQEEASLFAEQN